MWHFLFALFPFWAILINFRFSIFSGLSQTLEKSTLGLSEEEKLAGSGEKKIILLSQVEPILEPKQKKRYFIISNWFCIFSEALNNLTLVLTKQWRRGVYSGQVGGGGGILLGSRHQNHKFLSIITKYLKLGKGSKPKQKQQDGKYETRCANKHCWQQHHQ